MKILFVGWAPFNDHEGRMGGIRVYVSSIISKLLAEGYDISYLSSGHLYSPFSGRPFILNRGITDNGARLYSLVNSEVIAPAMFIEGRFDFVCGGARSLHALRQFLHECGPFDVVHIHSMEGLPYSFLSLLKSVYPSTKVLYSLHHYHDLCPRVDLFRGDHRYEGGVNCKSNDEGAACVGCYHHDPRPLVNQYIKDYINLKFRFAPKFLRSHLKNVARRFGRYRKRPMQIIQRAHSDVGDIDAVTNYRNRRIELRNILEKNVDVFLPVSARTRAVYGAHGYDVSRFKVEYIGTSIANNKIAIKNNHGNIVTICYMGYCNKMKGFDYFLRGLQELEPRIVERVKIVIAGRMSHEAHASIRGLKLRFATVIHDGYDRRGQRQILSGVDLGVVPPLWEDNLPQVAYEFVCSGVPIIATDLGGAHEIISEESSDFIVGHNDPGALTRQITRIVENPEILASFKYKRERVLTEEEHLARLLDHYRGVNNAPFAHPAPFAAQTFEKREDLNSANVHAASETAQACG